MAKIERAESEVSLDQLVRAFTAAVGKVVVKATSAKTRKASTGCRSKKVVKSVDQVILKVETSK